MEKIRNDGRMAPFDTNRIPGQGRPRATFGLGGLIVAALIGLPLVEIAVFIVVSRAIGVTATIGLVLLSMIAGTTLMRRQGFGVLRRMQAELDSGRVPGEAMVHGAMIVLAGVLLIIPGFVSDVVGLALFLPPVRDFVWSAIRRRIEIVTVETRAPGGPGPVVDLDADAFRRRDGHDGGEPGKGGSPWVIPPPDGRP